MEVVDCERQIQQIKTALRKIATSEGASSSSTTSSNTDEDAAPNKLQVVWVGMDKTVSDDVELSLQLSSPVEEATLTKVAAASADGSTASTAAVDGSSVTFSGVESSMATLTVTMKKGGEILGTSESYDLSPICSLEDAMNPKEEYVTELPVAIISPEAAAAAQASKGQAAGNDDAEEETKEGGEEGNSKKEGSTAVIKPFATLKLKLVFKPSYKDQKEELYELLNKTSLRKSEALTKLREQQQSSVTAGGASGSSPGKKSGNAVKAGFLNKKTKTEPDSKLKQWYDKYMGPQSMARALIIPLAKNYVIFFGAAVLMHFKGQDLALPAPV